MTAPCTEQTLRALEWDRLLAVVAGHARSAMGVERCRALVLADSADAARRRLAETAEALATAAEDKPLPAIAMPDIRSALGRAVKDAVLEPHELRDVAVTLALADEAVRFFRSLERPLPALSDLAAPLMALDQLAPLRQQLERAVDPGGQIRDNATPELRRLTGQANDLKQGMRRRLDTILASARYADVLQEKYFAEREGRYVVLVKAESQSKIPGIVHDVSASGATVFLEPRELVELNNAIKVSEREIEREVRRLLQELSGRIAAHGDELAVCLDRLAELDVVGARAAFAARIGGQPVTVTDGGPIALRQARHPLLVLTREQVVPNDIVLGPDVRVFVISGPNTGGKTVTLKIAGLAALMVRAGLLPACRADSELPFISNVFADIGDTQDLSQNLSSFSAHVAQLISLLETAPARGAAPAARWLVLLDELATSTDPEEGAALAEALLRDLADRGMTVIVTTHYPSLKALAQSTPGFMNASVGFDVATLSPTYRLLSGMPGGSSAIDIAGRLGLDAAILERALGVLERDGRGRDARRLERMLADVQAMQRRLEEDRAAAAAARAQAEAAAREAAEVAERLRAGEREERRGVRRKLTEELLRARADVQGVLDELKRARTADRAREAKARLAEIEQRAGEALAASQERVPVDALRAGDAVEIAGLSAAGVLLEAPQGRKRIRVKVGDAEMSVAASRLVGVPAGSAQPRAAAAGAARRPQRIGDADAPSVVDVRGRTADEALEDTVAALDRAALAGQPQLRIIHGHGTGRLKASIREYVRTSPYVESSRPGDRGEGGDGVTVVELKKD
jgi:DNA mismatch repair protein MutS2